MDIVIHGRTKDQRDKRQQLVLERLAEYHITLNPNKRQFARTEINFLGYHVSSQGVLPLYSNVKTIEELPQPTSAKEVASFLGTPNFYLKFVAHYADTAEPRRRLLRKDVPWDWTDEQDQAFRTLKHKITSAPILAHFDLDAQTIVTTDASGTGHGAVLSQVSGGKERPVAYASKTLSATERKYSTGEREALACIFACEYWHVFLFGRKFILRTDHQALTTLLATSGSGHRPVRIYRWSETVKVVQCVKNL